MAGELTFRIVTSAAELDDEVAAAGVDYTIKDVAKVALEPVADKVSPSQDF